jgi:ribosomal-protein-alanine N-acetyltransferase
VPTIRKRTDADLAACVALLRDVHETAGYPINWPNDPKGWLTPPSALGSWVITVDDDVAGHVLLATDGDQVLVQRLFVDPVRTGEGLGSRLLAHCVSVAAAADLPLSLEVADNHGAAIALYISSGWRETGRTPIDWGGSQAFELISFTAPQT